VTEAEYFSTPGLSQSALKDLAVSPLRFWHNWVNPDRVEEPPTAAMSFGSALHCAVLESEEVFMSRYAREVSADDYPGCLVTIEDLRGWLRTNGHTPKGTRKDDVIAQVQAVDSNVPILEVIERRNAAENEGKAMLLKEDWERVGSCREALLREPTVKAILALGRAEVPMFARCTETGVPLKCKPDLVTPSLILDIKTFTAKRGSSIDEAVHNALYYEGYLKQAWFYTYVRQIAEKWKGDFVFAFVESDPPHEVRIKRLKPGGDLYWQTAGIEVRQLIRLYAHCKQRFGDKPWRDEQEIEQLRDEDIKPLAYA
jgi:hypothetical protein